MPSTHCVAQYRKREPPLLFIGSDRHPGMPSPNPGARVQEGLSSRLSRACKVDDAGNIIVKCVLQTFDLTIPNRQVYLYLSNLSCNSVFQRNISL
jgi:hypothetical protein